MRAALFATPLPNHGEGLHKGGRMAGHYTFFEYNHWYSQLSKAQEARAESIFAVMDVGTSFWGKVGLRLGALTTNWAGWVGTCYLAALELWRYPVFGKGVGDHHYKPRHAELHAAAGAVSVVKTAGGGAAAPKVGAAGATTSGAAAKKKST